MWPDTPPIMFFKAHSDPTALHCAFQALVDAYPILGARLGTTPPTTSGCAAHATRHKRAWAFHDGPGAALLLAEWSGPLADVLPSPAGRALKVSEVLPDLCGAPLVSLRPKARPGPALAAQITRFEDGVALAIKVSHALADAHTGIGILRDWVSLYNALRAGKLLPQLKGTWAPTINAAAAGDIDADAPDPHLVEEARTLPGLRLDVTRAAPGSSPMPFFKLPPALDVEGDTPPWDTWAWMAPTAQRILPFSSAQMEAIHAATDAPGVSKLDALLALLWGAIVRARGLGAGDEVSLASCVGLRPRVDPPLGDASYGSPLLVTATRLDASDVGDGAAAIRRTISAYTPARVGAELHRMAYASDPVRRFTCFFGRFHSFSTSWRHLGAYEVAMDGVTPEWVLSGTHGADGLIIVGEARDGVNVQLWLEEGAMARVLADPAINGN